MFESFKVSAKALRYSLLFGLMCAVFLSFSDFNAGCEDLRHNILRLHIIANSNSVEDQALKLKIRDRILNESGDIFALSESVDDAVTVAEEQLPALEKIANEVIAEEGFDYDAKASVGYGFFETRVYDEFTLPAGRYKSLIINVGESKGKNWWCVIFPEICLPAASDRELSDTVNEDGVRIAEDSDRYILRFKVIEIYEDIKNWLKK